MSPQPVSISVPASIAITSMDWSSKDCSRRTRIVSASALLQGQLEGGVNAIEYERIISSREDPLQPASTPATSGTVQVRSNSQDRSLRHGFEAGQLVVTEQLAIVAQGVGREGPDVAAMSVLIQRPPDDRPLRREFAIDPSLPNPDLPFRFADQREVLNERAVGFLGQTRSMATADSPEGTRRPGGDRAAVRSGPPCDGSTPVRAPRAASRRSRRPLRPRPANGSKSVRSRIFGSSFRLSSQRWESGEFRTPAGLRTTRKGRIIDQGTCAGTLSGFPSPDPVIPTQDLDTDPARSAWGISRPLP